VELNLAVSVQTVNLVSAVGHTAPLLAKPRPKLQEPKEPLVLFSLMFFQALLQLLATRLLPSQYHISLLVRPTDADLAQ
jgi:hypothetical protein